MALDTGSTFSIPTRFPGGVGTAAPTNPLNLLEVPSPFHSLLLGYTNHGTPGLPTGNTPATNADYTVTSVTTTGTASLAAAAVYPPMNLLTTGTTASDQVFIQDKRLLKKNLLSLRRVVVGGLFQVTSTVANQSASFGLFSGTSNAALGNDEFGFALAGATLNFVNKNNGGTTLTTAISAAVTINTLYGAVAVLNPAKLTVSVYFGVVDSLGFKISTSSPQELAVANSGIAVATTNVPDGTNSVQLAFGALTSAGAAATVQFGSVFAYLQ